MLDTVKYEARFVGSVAVPTIDKELSVCGADTDEAAIRAAEQQLIDLHPVYNRAWVWKTVEGSGTKCIADISTRITTLRRKL